MTYRDDQGAVELRIARLEKRLAVLRDDEAWLLHAHEEQSALENLGVFEQAGALRTPLDPARLKALADRVYDADGRLDAVDDGWVWGAERGRTGSIQLRLRGDRLRLEDRTQMFGLGYVIPVLFALLACSVMLLTRELSSVALLAMSIGLGLVVRSARRRLFRRRAWQWRELNRRLDAPAVRVSGEEDELFDEQPAIAGEMTR